MGRGAAAHRLPGLYALGLEHDSKGAVANHALSEVADDLLAGPAAPRGGDHVADIVGVTLCSGDRGKSERGSLKTGRHTLLP
jgi:hypothetical protein